MEFLLSETDAFYKRESTKLFTGRFLKFMFEEADLKDKLNKGLAKPKPSSSGRGRARGNTKSRGQCPCRGRGSFNRPRVVALTIRLFILANMKNGGYSFTINC